MMNRLSSTLVLVVFTGVTLLVLGCTDDRRRNRGGGECSGVSCPSGGTCPDGFVSTVRPGQCCPVCFSDEDNNGGNNGDVCQGVVCSGGTCPDGTVAVQREGECCPVCEAFDPCSDVDCVAVECEEGFRSVIEPGACCPTCVPDENNFNNQCPPCAEPFCPPGTNLLTDGCCGTACESQLCEGVDCGLNFGDLCEGGQWSVPEDECCPVCDHGGNEVCDNAWWADDKFCEKANEECAVLIVQTDCCGNSAAYGINVEWYETHAETAGVCAARFPQCDCPTQPTLAESGQRGSANDIRLTCQDNECRTFVAEP